ncbi:PilZ domain-containing protein [Candidatus Magnetomoraceae bacterium gMMP-15]
MNKNKRKLERFTLKLPIQLVVNNNENDKQLLEVVTKDICAGGAFFNMNTPLPVGTEISVNLELPLDDLKKIEGQKVRINIAGSVIRIENNGIAVNFDKGYKISPVHNDDDI